MRKTAWVVLGVIGSSFAAAACTMSDDDRCPNGYQYISEIKVCCLEKDANGYPVEWDGSKCQSLVPVDTNEDVPEGLGDSCSQSGDAPECEGKEANFCAMNPLDAANAYCTTIDCAPGDCASGYQCCDCSAATIIPKEKACLKDADAKIATDAKQCTCAP